MPVTSCASFSVALAGAITLATHPYILLAVSEDANSSITLVLSTPTPAPSQQTFRFALPLEPPCGPVVTALLIHGDIVKVVFAGSDACVRIRAVLPPGVEVAPVLDLQMVACLACGVPRDDATRITRAQRMDSDALCTFGTSFVAQNKTRTVGRREILGLEECVTEVLRLRGGPEELVQDPDPAATHARLLAHLLARLTLDEHLPSVALCTSRNALLQGLSPLLDRSARFVTLATRGTVEFDAEMWPVGEPIPTLLRSDAAEPARDNWLLPPEMENARDAKLVTRAELESTHAMTVEMCVAPKLAHEETEESRVRLDMNAQHGVGIPLPEEFSEAVHGTAMEERLVSSDAVDATEPKVQHGAEVLRPKESTEETPEIAIEERLATGDAVNAFRNLSSNDTEPLAVEASATSDGALATPTSGSASFLFDSLDGPQFTVSDSLESPAQSLSKSALELPLSDCASHSVLYHRNNSTELVDYEVCTTSSSVLTAITVLRSCPYILLDCEGLSLGAEDGVLSIISLGTPFFTNDASGALVFSPLGIPSSVASTTQRIYLIDALSLDGSSRAALADLLSADNIVKVVWDGRSDEIELREALGVGMTSCVLDLQIVEICGRVAVRGEADSRRRARINERVRGASGTNGKVVKKNTRPLFSGMHVMLGMDACVEEYVPSAVVRKDGNVTKQIFGGNGVRVLERPAPDALLDYAAADVRMLAHIARCFSMCGFICSGTTVLNELFVQSNRHVSRNGLTARKQPQPHRVGWLLLFDALKTPYKKCLLMCSTCGARLPSQAFETRNEMRREQCRLCVVGSLVLASRVKKGKKAKNGVDPIPETWVAAMSDDESAGESLRDPNVTDPPPAYSPQAFFEHKSPLPAIRRRMYHKTGRSELVEYELCTTPASVLSAIHTLLLYPFVLLNCTGHNIGFIDGVLSVLSLGTPLLRDKDEPAMQRIFLIDVFALMGFGDDQPSQAIAGLLSSTVTKVVFDGRMDNIELQAYFGVPLSNVLDLQIVDIVGRQSTDQDRMDRLRRRLGWKIANKSNMALFADIHITHGLSQMLSERDIAMIVHKDKGAKNALFAGDKPRVLERPAPDDLLDWASAGLRILARTFQHFCERGIIPVSDSAAVSSLLALSARHVSRNGLATRDKQKPIRVGCIMLMDGLTAPMIDMVECQACGARLPQSCFEHSKESDMRREQCRACVVGALSDNTSKVNKEAAKSLQKTWVPAAAKIQ